MGKVIPIRGQAEAVVTVSVPLILEANVAMGNAAAREKLSQTDVVNRALQVYDFLQTHVAEGCEVQLRRRGHPTVRVTFG